jgi:CRISPR/Cas system CMR subunit Cmr6 (Cas7 group RAMP superfamily)
LKKKIGKVLKDDLFENDQNYDYDKIIDIYEQKKLKIRNEISSAEKTKQQDLQSSYDKYKCLVQDIKDYQQALFHENVARAQRIAYKNDHESIQQLKETLLIELDFKQKIVIGMSPRQVNKEYYQQQIRSCLGL